MSLWHPRAKTNKKTFSGCWTCRERKVKCDEGRPSCQQCISRDFECQGYALRLQWLAPLTLSSGGYGSSAPTACGSVRRRAMFCEPPRKIFSDRKLDSLLDQIEADAPSSGLLTVSYGPFAAFTATKTDCLDDSTSLLCVQAVAETHFAQQHSGVLTDGSPDPASPVVPHKTKSELRLWERRRSSEIRLPVTPQSPFSTSPGSNTTDTSRVPAQVEYLLHHYTTEIVDLMSAVPTPKGAWKTVHLPRALQGCGEISSRGTTSHARNALLHALLTISAYNLAAKNAAAGQALDASSWREVALKHSSRSLTSLNACLQSDCPVLERGKYKEVLAAMLSMITIEACSGDTDFSEWHLKGIEDFIRAAQRKPGRRYSRKAQALHRDYVYLRIMRETTNLRCTAPDAFLDPCSETITAWLCRPLCFLDSLNAPAVWLQESGPGRSMDYSACEFVYGIPLQLLVLASKTSELIRRKKIFEQHYPGLVAPALFLTMCDDLELQVLKWPVDRMVGDIDKLSIPEGSRNLIIHQTRAFHQAVIIYFSRLVRGVHRRHLQPYAESIIDHLEAVERIKDEADLVASCISWPWFVGAAEAMSEELRSRYLQWSRSLRFYDLGTYDKVTEVILEVWERDKMYKGLAPVCDWPTVIEDKDFRLMLI